jgi:hypothetical protein
MAGKKGSGCGAPLGHEAYPGCETGGRPKRYDEKFIEEEADHLEKWMEKKENIFIEDFCLERGYSYNRAVEWSKTNEKFSVTYDRFQMKQRVALFKGGLSKKFAFPMCALLLSHSHGIVSKSEQKLSGDAGNPLSFLMTKADGLSKELINE